MNKIEFPASFFINNRQKLKNVIGDDQLILLTGNGLLQKGADVSYPFVQDANFWYLTGIDDPDISLVIDHDREFLVVPIREGSRVAFDGQINEDGLSRVSGIRDIVNEASGWKRIDGLLAKNKKLAILAPAPSYIEQYGMYANPARSRLMERLAHHGSELDVTDVRSDLARLRMIKQDVELKAIRQAIDITVDSLANVLSKPYGYYNYEYEIEADIGHGFRYAGAQGHAFDPIVAGGKRACTLHNVDNSAALNKGELVVLDVGASVNYYAADITRVYATAKPNKRQKEVFLAVSEAQAYAFSLLKAGVHLKTYENNVAQFIGKQLKQLKLIKSVNESAIRTYFPHATSHFLGLNVHDVGDYQTPLKAGSVITVEPGIYIAEEGIGVRLEDDVLITKTGIEILSQKLATKLNNK